MQFNYAKNYINNDHSKWVEFDNFLEELSILYPEEFIKNIYETGRFMAIGVSSTYHAIIFTPHAEMAGFIANTIRNKINELWPRMT